VEPEDVRLLVYASFASTGHAPSLDELVAMTGQPQSAAAEALRQLAGARHLVLGPDGHVVMAHPFSAVPLGFSVMGRHTLWWGGCAWDSFALPHLLPREPEVLVATRCPGCGRALAWTVGRDAPPAGAEVAHFLVPVAHMWDDVVHTCAHQRLFCGHSCVDDWLSATGNARGYVMDLAQLWRLARHWYDGRLDRGYQRREPERAKEYLASVGLSGEFWGLA
jgi:Alkylmercury lyase